MLNGVLQSTFQPMSKRVLSNPYAKHVTALQVPFLRAKAGQDFHYPWIAPEGHEQYKAPKAISSADKALAPGWSILPGWNVGSEGKGAGKRQQVFKLTYLGRDTGKFALSPEGAAKLSHKLDALTMKKAKTKSNPRYPKALARARAVEKAYNQRTTPPGRQKMLARARDISKYGPQASRKAQQQALAQAHRVERAYDQRTTPPNRAAMLDYARELAQNYDDSPSSSPAVMLRAYRVEQAYDQSEADPNRAAMLDYAYLLNQQATDNPVWIRPEGSARARGMEEAYDEAYDNPRSSGGKASKYASYSNSDLRKLAAVGDIGAAKALEKSLLAHQGRMAKTAPAAKAPRPPRVRAPAKVKVPTESALTRTRKAAAIAAEAEIFDLLRKQYGDAVARSISESMYDFDYEGGKLGLTLASSKYTAFEVDDPKVIKQLRDIGKKYADAGVSVTVAVRNPRY